MVETINLGPTIVDLQVSQDADFLVGFTLTDGLGVPLDITNDTIKFTVKDYFGGTNQFQKENTPGQHEDPTNGYTTFLIEKTDITLSADRYSWVYELRRIQPGGNEAVHVTGKFIADPAVGD